MRLSWVGGWVGGFDLVHRLALEKWKMEKMAFNLELFVYFGQFYSLLTDKDITHTLAY